MGHEFHFKHCNVDTTLFLRFQLGLARCKLLTISMLEDLVLLGGG